MPFAKKVAEKLDPKLAESALKEMTEEQIRVIIQRLFKQRMKWA